MNEWFIWSSLLLVFWLSIFLFAKRVRKEMLWASLFTMPFGLTEPFFVPEYWNPPSLFDLAAKTGFDIESFIFAFTIGGIAAVLYELFFMAKHKKIPKDFEKKHKLHRLALLSPFITFFLLELFTNLNPIYSAIIALFVGGISAVLCRLDLKNKALFGGFIFLVFYFLFFLVLNLISPGWIQGVWNLKAISGILFLGIPIEELLFAFALGIMWSGVYEHFKEYT